MGGLFVGQDFKKDNPAIDILKRFGPTKSWEWGEEIQTVPVRQSMKSWIRSQYSSTRNLIKSKIFKGDGVCVRPSGYLNVTSNTYLPIFVNEAFSKVYGDNQLWGKRNTMRNKASGFETTNRHCSCEGPYMIMMCTTIT